MEVSDPTSPGAKPKHESDPTVPTLGQHRPLITLARRLLEEVCDVPVQPVPMKHSAWCIRSHIQSNLQWCRCSMMF